MNTHMECGLSTAQLVKVAPKLDRSFQIYQHKLLEGEADIAAWVKDFEHDALWIEDEWPRMPRAMLVINLALSHKTAEVARSLLRRWMAPRTTVTEMRAFIDQTPAGGPADNPGWPPYADDDSSGDIQQPWPSPGSLPYEGVGSSYARHAQRRATVS